MDRSLKTTKGSLKQSNPEMCFESSEKLGNEVTAGQLALEMMHEIRNPLEALGHLTYLTLEEADKPEKVRNYMHLAEEQIATLTQIVRQTLGVAKSSPAPQATDLVDLTEAALRIHQRAIKAKSIHLVKKFPENLITEVCPGEMLQLLSNLIVNALDALQSNGTLCLRLKRCHGKVRIIIADSGHGIPIEHLEQIFQPFFTTKEAYGGTGLGLALSKPIIEKHSGTICIRSCVASGKSGTTFRVSLRA